MAEVKESEQVCKDILNVLKEATEALPKHDSKTLSEISNHTIHCISIYQSQRAFYVAIIMYALSKIVEKEARHPEELDEFLNGIAENLDAAAEFIEESNFKEFDAALAGIIKEISEFDKSFSNYIQEVIEFAKIQKGANIYEHGLSLSSVAKIIGLSKWQLMEKISETTVHEQKETKALSSKERISKAKKILGAD